MLTYLHVDNYKTLVNFDLRPRKIDLWAGNNGTGKTSVVEVLKGVRELLRGAAVPDTFPTKSLTRWQDRDQQEIALTISLTGVGDFRYELKILHDRDRQLPLIASEKVASDGVPLFSYDGRETYLFRDDGTPLAHFPFGKSRSFIPEIEPGIQNRKIVAFRDYLTAIRILRPDPLRIKSTADGLSESLGDGAENLANWYRALSLSEADSLPGFFTRLADFIPGLISLRFPSKGTGNELEVKVKVGRKDCILKFEELSEGQKMLIALYAASQNVGGGLWIFDEPDNFVAISEIQPWLVNLRESIVASSGQAFVISHHPETIDYLSADGASIFGLANGITQTRDLSGMELNGAALSSALAMESML